MRLRRCLYRENDVAIAYARLTRARYTCLRHAKTLKPHVERAHAVKVTMPKDERSSDDQGDDAVMFGVAHGLRARDHAMATRYTSLLEDPSERSRYDIVCDDV